MLDHLIAFLTEPERYACVWRDGELFIVPAQACDASADARTFSDGNGEDRIAA